MSTEDCQYVVSLYRVVIKEDKLGTYLSHLDEVISHSKLEPGILRIEVFRDRNAPNIITIMDVFRDQAALDEHLTKEHLIRFRNCVAESIAEPGRASLLLLSGRPKDTIGLSP